MSSDESLAARLARAEQARRTAEAVLNESQRLAGIGSWSWLVDPDIVTWSDEMFRIAGRDPAAGTPSFAEQATMYSNPEVLIAAVQKALQTGEPFEVDVALRRPGGEELWIRARGAVSKDGAGAPVRMHGTAKDITEARAQQLALLAAYDKLERSERRYRDLVENLVEVVFSLDLEGRVVYVSPGVARFGYDPVELAGLHFTRIFHPDDVAAGESTFRRTLSGRVQRAEYRILDKSGAVRHVQVSARATFEADQLAGITGIARDITQLRQAEEQLRVAQRLEAIGQLAGGIAHDFNNILVVILGFADLALDHLGPGDPVRAHLEQISRAGERAADLIRQLLAFSRRQVLKPEVISLNDVVRGLEGMLQRLIGEDVVFRTRLVEDLAPILADPGQIEQVIMNLVVNARDAMPNGGAVTIETMPGDAAPGTAGLVMLRVRDTGHGMDAATQAQIFEPFFTTKPVGEGTGLGLSTAYGIVKQSGGTMAVDSRPGKGSVFTLAFPPDTSGSPVVRRAAARAPAGDARAAVTVLVVDDDEGVRDLARRFLCEAGYEVIAAPCAATAVEAFEARDGRVDLLLADVAMPGMSGDELVRRLSARWPELRVLFMAQHTGTTMSRPLVADPVWRVVAKPFTRLELTRRVREALDEWEPRPPGSASVAFPSGPDTE